MSMQASVADRRAAYSILEDVLAGLTAPQILEGPCACTY
jgi:hypothetical protein